MIILYVLVAQYLLGIALLVHRTVKASDLYPRLPRHKRIVLVTLSLAAWPYQAFRLLWEDFR